MSERTEGSIRIAAVPAEVMAVVTDLAAYPEWAAGVREAEVLQRDARGRPTRARFHIATPPIEARYTLAYRYAARARGVSWTTVEASGAVRDVRGEYVLEPADGGTTVTYRLTMEPAISLPGILRRRAERRIVDTALGGLRRRVEAGGSGAGRGR